MSQSQAAPERSDGAPLERSRSAAFEALSQTHVRWLLAILGVALAARLLWVVFVFPDPTDGRVDDAAVHYQLARSLADGEGYVGPEGEATAIVPPGYPAMLSLAFLIPGDDVAAGIGINIVAGLIIVVSTYYLASRLWDRRAGLIAAGIMALFPSHIFSTSLLMKEVVFAALLVGVLALTLMWTIRTGGSSWQVIVIGALVALAAMIRPEGFVLVPVILLAWLINSLPLRTLGTNALLLVLGITLLVAPWTVRNAAELDSPIISGTGGALVLVDGHHDGAGGQADLEHSVALAYTFRYRDLPPKEREVRVYEEATADSIDYFFSNLTREAQLAPDRLAWFFRGDRFVLFYVQNGVDGGELSVDAEQFWGVVADTYYYGLAVVMVLTLPFWVARMRREHALLWGVFAAYVLLWAFVFVGQARYHIPLLPIFAVVAGMGASAALALAQSRMHGRKGKRLESPAT